MRRALTVLAVLIMAGSPLDSSFAKIDIPGRTGSWVNDYAGIIDEATRSYLEDEISSIKQRTPEPFEVIISTFKSLEGWEFSEFARLYGEKWREVKIGKRDNGVIILVALDQQRVTIGVGQNLKGILTVPVLQDIIQHVIVPEFREMHYAEGIKKAAERVMDIVGKANIPTRNPHLYYIIIGVIIAVASFLAFRGLKGKAKG